MEIMKYFLFILILFCHPVQGMAHRTLLTRKKISFSWDKTKNFFNNSFFTVNKAPTYFPFIPTKTQYAPLFKLTDAKNRYNKNKFSFDFLNSHQVFLAGWTILLQQQTDKEENELDLKKLAKEDFLTTEEEQSLLLLLENDPKKVIDFLNLSLSEIANNDISISDEKLQFLRHLILELFNNNYQLIISNFLPHVKKNLCKIKKPSHIYKLFHSMPFSADLAHDYIQNLSLHNDWQNIRAIASLSAETKDIIDQNIAPLLPNATHKELASLLCYQTTCFDDINENYDLHNILGPQILDCIRKDSQLHKNICTMVNTSIDNDVLLIVFPQISKEKRIDILTEVALGISEKNNIIAKFQAKHLIIHDPALLHELVGIMLELPWFLIAEPLPNMLNEYALAVSEQIIDLVQASQKNNEASITKLLEIFTFFHEKHQPTIKEYSHKILKNLAIINHAAIYPLLSQTLEFWVNLDDYEDAILVSNIGLNRAPFSLYRATPMEKQATRKIHDLAIDNTIPIEQINYYYSLLKKDNNPLQDLILKRIIHDNPTTSSILNTFIFGAEPLYDNKNFDMNFDSQDQTLYRELKKAQKLKKIFYLQHSKPADTLHSLGHIIATEASTRMPWWHRKIIHTANTQKLITILEEKETTAYQQNNISFIHGQSRAVAFSSILYNRLRHAITGQTNDNFLYMRYLANNIQEQESDQNTLRLTLLNGNRREDSENLLFLNSCILGGCIDGQGACTLEYTTSNKSIYINDQLIEKIFEQLNATKLYPKYKNDIEILKQEFEKLHDTGITLSIRIPKNIVNNCVYLALPGGKKHPPLTNNQGQKFDKPLELLEAITNNPEQFKDQPSVDTVEYVLVLTKDLALNPFGGIKYEMIDLAAYDTTKTLQYQQYQERFNNLLQMIICDILKIKAYS